MPPRSLTLAIIGFWLAAMSWLFYRDIWPDLRPGQWPPFTIDLSTEKDVGGQRLKTRWALYRNGMRNGGAESWTVYHADRRTYELRTDIIFEQNAQNERERIRFTVAVYDIEASRMSNTYYVTQNGELLSF